MGKFLVGSALALVLTTSSWSQEVDPVIVVAAHKIEVPCQSAPPVKAVKKPRRHRVHYHHVAKPHPTVKTVKQTKVAYKHPVRHKHAMRPKPVCYAETAPFNPEYLALLADAPPVPAGPAPAIANFAPINVGGTAPPTSPNEEFFPGNGGGSSAPFGALPTTSGGPGGGHTAPPGGNPPDNNPPGGNTPPPGGTPPGGGPPPPVTGVPEPATWAMSIVGFYAMGAAIRRRRRQTATSAA